MMYICKVNERSVRVVSFSSSEYGRMLLMLGNRKGLAKPSQVAVAVGEEVERDLTEAHQGAMWAMLLAVRQYNNKYPNSINSVVCPGLGTGIGRVPYSEAARQMALAYDHFLYPPKWINCFVAASRQLQILEGSNTQ